MNTISLLIIVPFTVALLLISKRMMSEKSIENTLNNYERDPTTASWFIKWFYRFRFKIQRDGVREGIEKYGDKRITSLYRFVGWVFMLFSLAITAATIFLVAST